MLQGFKNKWVKVTSATDETCDISFMGRIGRVVYFDYDCGCGQSEDDPMIGVNFDGTIEEFWKEELTLCPKIKRRGGE